MVEGITHLTYILSALVCLFLFGTVWYRRKLRQKEDESDYFTYHYIRLRRGGSDTGMSDAVKLHHAGYEKRIREWEMPVFDDARSGMVPDDRG